MYVCLCRGINTHTVCSTVAAGARSLEDLAATCGAGTRCGGCLPSLRRLLLDVLRDPLDPATEAATAASDQLRRSPLRDGTTTAATRPADGTNLTPGARMPNPMLGVGGHRCEEATVSSRCSTTY